VDCGYRLFRERAVNDSFGRAIGMAGTISMCPDLGDAFALIFAPRLARAPQHESA
jgi:hypothetical protein